MALYDRIYHANHGKYTPAEAGNRTQLWLTIRPGERLQGGYHEEDL